MISKRRQSTVCYAFRMTASQFYRAQKLPNCSEAVGELCLDIEIHLEALEAVHAALGRNGIQVLFCILSGHCEHSKQLVIVPEQFVRACFSTNSDIHPQVWHQKFFKYVSILLSIVFTGMHVVVLPVCTSAFSTVYMPLLLMFEWTLVWSKTV